MALLRDDNGESTKSSGRVVGHVYATDANGAGDKVHTIDVPEAKNDPNTYWIAAVRGGNSAKARAFIEQVTGDGQKTLKRYGFGPPTR